MKEEKIEKIKAQAVEEYRKGIVEKVSGIGKILSFTMPVDNSGKLTQEELLAIRSGARSAYAYVLGLLGADGEQSERRARKAGAWRLAELTVDIGAEIHKVELEEYGL